MVKTIGHRALLVVTAATLFVLGPALSRWPSQPLPAAEPEKADPLPSWNDGPTRDSILKFVRTVTDKTSPQYVPPEERIATFDNDGTLWTEQPDYVEVVFAVAEFKRLAGKNPEWKQKQPFKAILEDDVDRVRNMTNKELTELLVETHTGMTTEEFDKRVKNWLATARHPRFKRPYTDLVYQPMLELLAYLRQNGFKTFIVSGGGIEFMRNFTEKLYGVVPEQVVGTSYKTKYEFRAGRPALVRLPDVDFVDNGPGKAIGINRFIGRRPIAAFGNSDGDKEMLEWTAAGSGARLMLLVHHTDAEREYAYDRRSPVGQLDKALDEADKRGWTVVDMKKDWKVIFPFERK
jgi:hypothetical protein